MKKVISKIETEIGSLYRCAGCCKYLSAQHFCSNKNNKYRDELNIYCKDCQSKRETAYRKNLNTKDLLKLKLKHLLSSARSRAKKLNLAFDLTEDYLYELWNKQKGICALSGIPLTCNYGEGVVETNASIDKIDPQGGYTIGNVQLTCWAVNRMKGTMNNEQLLFFCENVVKYYKQLN